MELYTVKFVFLAMTLQLSFAFLIDDISSNQTSDLITLLLEQKRQIIQLEQRLGETEIRFQKFADAVTAELKAERDKINILEQTVNNCTSENEESHKDIAAVTSELQTAEMFILNKMDIDIKNATNEIQRNVVKRVEESVNNSRIEVDKLLKEVQRLNFTFDSHLANMSSSKNSTISSVAFNKLVKEVQRLNITFESRLVNLSTSRKDNMVAFNVDSPDSNHHNPMLYRYQWLDVGGGYTSSTGKFICSKPGVYVFTWNAIQQGTGTFRSCCLNINTSTYGNSCATLGDGKYPSASRTVIAHVRVHDEVYLRCSNGTLLNPFSAFSGFLLYPEN